MRLSLLIMVICVLSFQARSADKSLLELNLVKDNIDVTTGFSGESLEVFGLKPEGGGDVIVVVKGPSTDVMVRRKDNVMGGWINRSSLVFKNVPSFHRVAATADPDSIASDAVLDEYEIGLDHSRFMTRHAVDLNTFQQFRAGLVRDKTVDGLFSNSWQPLDVLNDKFFRTSFYFPDNVVFGDYSVEAFYFENGLLAQRTSRSLRIDQVGMSARVKAFSRDVPWLYGVLCVFLALYTGWFSHRLRQKF